MRGISQSNKHNSYDTYYDSRPSFIEYFHLKSNFLIYIIVVVMISHDGFHRSQKTLIVTQGNLNHQGAEVQLLAAPRHSLEWKLYSGMIRISFIYFI